MPYVILSVPEYNALREAANARPRPGEPGDGLATAVALLTARHSGWRATRNQLAPDVDADAVTRVLVVILDAILSATLPDDGDALLQDLGLLAADPDNTR